MDRMSCGCIVAEARAVVEMCAAHEAEYRAQIEKRMSCSRGSCGE